MEILYISHCVPWPPDKGDRIRAFHTLRELLAHHRVHLACLARSASEAAALSELRRRCASVQIEVLEKWPTVMRGFLSLATGGAFTTGFYDRPPLRRHIEALVVRHPIKAAVVLSSAMAPYVPRGLPYLADWGDVDSEKWFQYARMRVLGFAQRLEGGRVRQVERRYAIASRRTFLTTPNELQLFQRIAPEAPVGWSGNGVDTATFDPAGDFAVPEDLRRRTYLTFVGVMDYFPNSDGACWFADHVYSELCRRDPALELYLVGRHPARNVAQLGTRDGITVTGEVADVRPYLAAARAVIAPLRIARGIQNKVLEALAMGKTVLASDEVCRTFEPDVPPGVVRCVTAEDYARALAALPATAAADNAIADATRRRFGWSANLAPMIAELDAIERETMRQPTLAGT